MATKRQNLGYLTCAGGGQRPVAPAAPAVSADDLASRARALERQAGRLARSLVLKGLPAGRRLQAADALDQALGLLTKASALLG
jgi:hypothetical protein